MSFDLYFVPTPGFLDWSDEQWHSFFDRDPMPESIKLGNAAYVARALEAISHNLEGGRAGSKYPLLMRTETAETVGWYTDEISQLLDELVSVRQALAALPADRHTLQCDSDEDFQSLTERLRRREDSAPLRNVYEAYRYFIDSFEEATRRAGDTQQGLFLSY